MNVKDREINRKFRVLDQTLSMHSSLGEKYKLRALVLDISLLTCATIFCATTFINENFYSSLGLTPSKIKLILGCTSIIAFLASIISLRIDWKGLYASHTTATQKLSEVLSIFRQTQVNNGLWPEEEIVNLSNKYNSVMNNIIAIPSKSFNNLKAKYLKKVEISKLISKNPGYPNFILKIIVLINSIKRFSNK